MESRHRRTATAGQKQENACRLPFWVLSAEGFEVLQGGSSETVGWTGVVDAEALWKLLCLSPSILRKI